MDKLEQFIHNKRQEYDQAEPSDGHFEKFQMKLAEFHSPHRKKLPVKSFLRVAAVILILITLSFAINYFGLLPKTMVKESAAIDLPPELKEVEMYYSSLTGEKLQQIDQLASSEQEAEKIKKRALSELNELENSNQQLQQEYAVSGKDERVLDAIRNNYRIITNLLDHIINELSTGEKQQSNIRPTS